MSIDIKRGDCLQLMRDIPDGSVDMILCDLPYGTTRNKWDVVIPLEELWTHYKRIAKHNAAIVLFSAEPFTSMLIQSNLKMFRYDLIWSKSQGTDFLNANRKPLRSHENIVLFSDGQTVYNPQKKAGIPYKARSSYATSSNYGKFKGNCKTDNATGERMPTTVMHFTSCNNVIKQHPTQKPTALLEYLIKTYTNAGDTVLDNCMGSGSTGVACVNTGRSFIGYEMDERYFAIAEQRINDAVSNSIYQQTVIDDAAT